MEINNEKRLSGIHPLPELTQENSAEYILPDYCPDIRKLLLARGEARPAARYDTDVGAECSGIVVYTALYLDGEGNLHSVSFSSDYDVTVKCPNESRLLMSDLHADNVNIRVTSPRKMVAKCNLIARAIAVEDKSADTYIEAPSDVEVATRVANFTDFARSSEKEREYAELLSTLDGAILDEVEIVYRNAECSALTARMTEDGVAVQGSLTLSALVRTEDAGVYLVEKRIPIDERVGMSEMPEMPQGAMLIPECTVSSVVANANATESGVEIVCSAIISFDAVAVYNKECELISDAYYRSTGSEAEYSQISYSNIVDMPLIRETVTDYAPRDGLEPEEIREIVCIYASPRIASSVCAEGIACTGEIRFVGVASEVRDDGSIGYAPLRFSLPIERVIHHPIGDEGCKCVCRFDAKNVSAMIERDRLCLDFTLECALTLIKDTECKVLTSLSMSDDECAAPTGAVVHVYYPEAHETLFDVARRYRMALTQLAADNAIAVSTSTDSPDSLCGVKRLIIYK